MGILSKLVRVLGVGLFLALSTQVQAEDIRIQSRFHPDQEVNIETGLKSSPAQPGWNSAMWTVERVDSLYIRLKNVWTGDYLRLNGAALEVAKVPAGYWDAQWEVVPVAGEAYSRLRNRYTGAYLNTEGGTLAAGTIQPNWWSAQWVLKGYTGSGANPSETQWMRKWGDKIADKKLNQLAIPGTHDSATYALQTTYLRGSNDLFAPDTDDLKRGLSFAGDLGYNAWARAQDQSVYKQLTDGIRYIDIRVCVDKSGTLMTCHGLYAASLQTVFNDVAKFASENPREIVVLQLQHVYDWGEKTANGKGNDASYTALSQTAATKLGTMISGTLGNYLVPRTGDNGVVVVSPSSTVRQIWGTDRQIILVTDLEANIDARLSGTPGVGKFLWSGGKGGMSYFWDGEGVDRDPRIASIAGHLAAGAENYKFMGIPLALSPDKDAYGKSFDPTGDYPSTLRSMAKQTNPVMMSYLSTDWKGLKPNILSTDWYNDTCIVAVTKGLNGIPASTSGCDLNRNQKWGNWKVGYEKIADAFTDFGQTVQYAFTGNPQEYTVDIDNCHSGLTGTDTTDTITLYLYDSNGVNFVQTSVAGSGSCSTSLSITTATKVTAFALGTSGSNAFYIDEAKMSLGKSFFQGGTVISDSGRDEGGGWCLSKDPNDGADWRAVTTGNCAGIIRFPQ